jgi:hypothetical protein
LYPNRSPSQPNRGEQLLRWITKHTFHTINGNITDRLAICRRQLVAERVILTIKPLTAPKTSSEDSTWGGGYDTLNRVSVTGKAVKALVRRG